MRPSLLALALLVSVAACGPEADAPSTAGPFDDSAVDAAPPVDRGAPPPTETAMPEPAEAAPAEAGTVAGPTTYDCTSGETIALERTDDGLRYTLDDQTVELAEEAEGRYATEAMWVTFEDNGRVTVTRDEDSTLDCTAR